MANRSQQQKTLKMKRRGRFAVFSGATSKFAVRIDSGRFHKDGTTVEIPVGHISLSKQVMSTGRGPDPERMQAYYARVTAESFMSKDDLTIKNEVYHQIWNDIPKECRINLVDNQLGRLDLYFSGRQWFFVDIDYRNKVAKRSRVYGSKAFALGRLHNKMVAWVETILLK